MKLEDSVGVANLSPAVPQLPSINVKETLELLECPICTEALVPPIFQCREGHALCNDCLEKVNVCPSCRSGRVDVRCRILERLADSIGDVACRYASSGCPERVKYRCRKDHESRCPYKSFVCLHRDLGCVFEGHPDSLVVHLVGVHGYQQLKTNKIMFTCNRQTQRSLTSGYADDQCVWQRQIYSCFDKHFVLRVHRRVDGDPAVYISLAVLHSKHHSNRYLVETEGNHRRYLFEGPVWSIRKGFKEVERVRDCLILPENIALFLSGGKGSENDLNSLNLCINGEILP